MHVWLIVLLLTTSCAKEHLRYTLRSKDMQQGFIICQRTIIKDGFNEQIIGYILLLVLRSVPEHILVRLYELCAVHCFSILRTKLLLFFDLCKRRSGYLQINLFLQSIYAVFEFFIAFFWSFILLFYAALRRGCAIL